MANRNVVRRARPAPQGEARVGRNPLLLPQIGLSVGLLICSTVKCGATPCPCGHFEGPKWAEHAVILSSARRAGGRRSLCKKQFLFLSRSEERSDEESPGSEILHFVQHDSTTSCFQGRLPQDRYDLLQLITACHNFSIPRHSLIVNTSVL